MTTELMDRTDVWQMHNDGYTMAAALMAIRNFQSLLTTDQRLAINSDLVDYARQVVVLCTAAAKKCKSENIFLHFISNAATTILDYYPITTNGEKANAELLQAWDQAYEEENAFVSAARDILKLDTFLSLILENKDMALCEQLTIVILECILQDTTKVTVMVLNFIVENAEYGVAKEYFQQFVEEHDGEDYNETIILTACAMYWRAFEKNDVLFYTKILTGWSKVAAGIKNQTFLQLLMSNELSPALKKAAVVDLRYRLTQHNAGDISIESLATTITNIDGIHTSPSNYSHI